MNTKSANLTDILHKISYLKWLFLLAAVVLIVYCLVELPTDLISITGNIVFIIGIQMGLESLEDIEKSSTDSLARYKDPNYIKFQSRFLFIGIIVTVAISILFLSLKLVASERNAVLFDQFFDLGLDCLALMLGLLCLLKSANDKSKYAINKLISVEE